MRKIKRPVEERFWLKVDQSAGPNGCWIWLAGHFTNGYGQFWVPFQSVLAHRFSWELANGPIPRGLWVCHHCDNRPCVNPAHLFLATSAGNTQDSVNKGRRARGETHGRSKLTKEEVLEIRKEYAHGGMLQQELADAYEVTDVTISHIVRRKTWRHI